MSCAEARRIGGPDYGIRGQERELEAANCKSRAVTAQAGELGIKLRRAALMTLDYTRLHEKVHRAGDAQPLLAAGAADVSCYAAHSPQTRVDDAAYDRLQHYIMYKSTSHGQEHPPPSNPRTPPGAMN